jgi:hypothetical protein
VSFKIISLLLKDLTPTFNPLEKLIMFILADFAHDDGSSVYPCIDTIRKKANSSRRAVLYALKSLQGKQGLILEKDNSRDRRPNLYRINVILLEALTKSPERSVPKKNPNMSRKRPVNKLLVKQTTGAIFAPQLVQDLHPTLLGEPVNISTNTVGNQISVDKYPPPNTEVANKHLTEDDFHAKNDALSVFIQDCQRRGIKIPRRYDHLTERLAA